MGRRKGVLGTCREVAGGIQHPPELDSTHRGCREGRKALSPHPCTAAKTDSKHNPMRSADGTKRAAGQRLEHWASHVSLGSKPQHGSLPLEPHSQEAWAPLSSPTGGHRGTSSKALFMCGAWTKDLLLPAGSVSTGPTVRVGVGQGWRPGELSRALKFVGLHPAASNLGLTQASFSDSPVGFQAACFPLSSARGHPQKRSPVVNNETSIALLGPRHHVSCHDLVLDSP